MSASVQYIRKLSAVVAKSSGQGIDFAQFRCVFTVRRGDFQTPNSCDLRIFNLSTQTQNLIAGSEFTTLSISAGYPGNFGLIFQGSIKQFRKGRVDGKDRFVDITAADGDEAFNFSTIFYSAPAGTPPSGIQAALLTAFQSKKFNQQIVQGYQPNFTQNGCVRGQVLCGSVRKEARTFAKTQQCKWSIQDGKYVNIPLTSFIPAAQIPVISPTTGLLDVPEQTPQGLRLKVLLNPNMKIGQMIQLQNTQVNQLRFGLGIDGATQRNNSQANTNLNSANPSSLYYVMAANHRGDTRGHGDDWVTEMTCLAVDASILTSEAANALTAVGAQSIPRFPGS
jgi:hypothetical protein